MDRAVQPDLNPDCPLCGAQQRSELKTSVRSLFFLCAGCGCIFRSSHLSPKQEYQRYLLHDNTSAGYSLWVGKFFDFATEAPLPSGAAVLDFGSGPVPLLARMFSEQGYRTETEDPFFSPGSPPGPFDLITSLEVFEHLSRPARVIQNLASRLKPGGRLCVSTEFRPADLSEFEKWHYQSDPTHIVFYTAEALSEAARRFGLETECCDGIRHIAFRLASRGALC